MTAPEPCTDRVLTLARRLACPRYAGCRRHRLEDCSCRLRVVALEALVRAAPARPRPEQPSPRLLSLYLRR